MRFCVLGSGSRGNCTLVEAGGTRLLIDAGFSCKEIVRRLAVVGVDPATLSGILITHEHGDHVRGVSVLAKKFRLPVHANPATLAAAFDGAVESVPFRPFATGEDFRVGAIFVHPFAVSHDAVEPVGYLLRNAGLSFGYCTDTGMVSRLIRHRLSGCHGLVLESNHDPALLAAGPYPPQLKQRVRSNVGHLANAEAGELLADLLHEEMRHVVLAHLSEKNNLPDLALQTVSECVARAAEKNGRGPLPRIVLAEQERVGDVVDLA